MANSHEPPVLSERRAYGLLVMVVLILGFNWPVMALGLDHFSPIWMTSLRLAVGFVVMAAFVGSRGGLRAPVNSDLPIIVSVAVFRLALVYILVMNGLRLVPPGRSSLLVYTASLWTVPMAAYKLKERPTTLSKTGLVIGLAGLLLLLAPWNLDWSDNGVLVGHWMLILAALMTAAFTVHVKVHRWTSTPPICRRTPVNRQR